MRNTLKPAILSLSLLTVMAGAAVSPSLGVIAERFPEAERLLVQMVVSLPALVIIPSLFLATWLTRFFSRRQILLTGLVVYTAGGMGGAFSNSIMILLFFRSILGVGVGMVMPFSTSLISDFFEGEERASLMGLSSASNMLGGLVALLLSGLLADISWRLPFTIYLFAIPVFLMNLKYLPEPPAHDNKFSGSSLPGRIYFLAIGMFFLNMTFFVLPPTIALFIRENSLGNPELTGVAISCSTAAGFLSGIFLQKTRKFTGFFHVPLMLLLMSGGFMMLHYSFVIAGVFAGNACIGFANRSLYPMIFFKATHEIPPEQSVKVTALLSSMIYLGQFLSPIFISVIGKFFNDTSFRFAYLFVSLVLLSGSILFAVPSIRSWRKKST